MSSGETAVCIAVGVGVVVGVIGIGSFVAGVVLLALYGVPQECPNMPVLRPGGQGSCNKTTSDMLYSAEVTTENGSSSLITYVFNQEPKRILVTEHFDFKFKSEKTLRYYIPLVPYAVYNWELDADTKMDIYFRSPKHGKTRGTIYCSKTGVSQGSGSYSSEKSRSNTYWFLTSSSSATGTFSLTVDWPQWDVNSVKPVDICTGYPCEWVFNNFSWANDKDLWIVTVNNGTKEYELTMTVRNKFVLSFSLSPFSFCCSSLFTFFFFFFFHL